MAKIIGRVEIPGSRLNSMDAETLLEERLKLKIIKPVDQPSPPKK